MGIFKFFRYHGRPWRGDISFLQLAVTFKTKKKNERKRKYWVPEFFRKQEEKGAFNNLTNENSQYGVFFIWGLIILINIFRNSYILDNEILAFIKESPQNTGNLRIHWRLSTILKTSKKVYEVMFFDM